MSQPTLSHLPTWQEYKERIIDLLLEALLELQKEPVLEREEVKLNRRLWFCIRRVCHRRQFCFLLPTPEGKNPPHADDEERAKREDKVPDFYWHFADSSEPDPDRCDRRFVLECKRLGSPYSPPGKKSSTWILNKNYVEHGVRRFIIEEWGYGQGDDEGGMIAYVQDMEFDDILNEINVHAPTTGVSTINPPREGWQVNGVSKLSHSLQRPFNRPSFLLNHYWIDLRQRYRTSAEQSIARPDT